MDMLVLRLAIRLCVVSILFALGKGDCGPGYHEILLRGSYGHCAPIQPSIRPDLIAFG
jgi:hypothetical protein